MDENSRICGVAWRPLGYPTISEYNAFISRDDALLKINFTDGHLEQIRLELIPHSPVHDDHYFVFPALLRAGDIKSWEAPKEVGILRIHFSDGSWYCLDRRRLPVPT